MIDSLEMINQNIPMDKRQLEIFRRALVAQRRDIEELNKASRDASGTVVLDQSKVGRLSRMDALQAQQMAHETARRRHLQLQRIDSALRRLDEDEYGYCFVCGDDIDPARLDFDPACTRCTGCMDN